MATTLDDVMELLIESLALDRGGDIRSRANLTGDDGDGVAEHGDLANPNIFKVNNNGLAVIGGRDSGGNYRVDFGGNKEEAQEFVSEVQDVFADFRSILTLNSATDHRGAPVDDSRPDTDIVEQLIFRAAEAFGGRTVESGSFSGDDFGDTNNFEVAANSVNQVDSYRSRFNDGVFDTVTITGGSTRGDISFEFDDAATAARFEDVLDLLVQWANPAF